MPHPPESSPEATPQYTAMTVQAFLDLGLALRECFQKIRRVDMRQLSTEGYALTWALHEVLTQELPQTPALHALIARMHYLLAHWQSWGQPVPYEDACLVCRCRDL